MKRHSIRIRITAIAAVISVVVLAVVAVIVVVVARGQLRDNLDRSLEQRADEVLAALGTDGGPALSDSNPEDRFVQVIADDGAVMMATANVQDVGALVALPVGRQEFATREDLPVEDDAFRVLVRRGDVAGEVVYVVVGENIDDLRDAVRAMVGAIAIAFPIAVLGLAVTVWWLVGRTLRPVEAIRREVESIGLMELDHRVPTPGTGDEIDLLAGTMNEMLARLEAASAKQRRFVADVSHELRTPLTRMRTTLEVDLAHPGADLEVTARAALGDAIDMQQLVDDLLFLARSDAGRQTPRHRLVDLDVVVDREVQRAREETAGSPRIDMSQVSAAVVHGDVQQLTRLVRNLLTNALRHADTLVRIGLSDGERGGVVLTVADDGPGVPPEDRERVFERFVRLDEARSSREGGTGLGLAIVRDIATAHGATATVGETPTGGATFEVRFPE